MHQLAGGTGTVNDPITECDQDWEGSGPNGGPRFPHIDLYIGSATDSGIVACEDSLTKDGQVDVLVDPPPNLAVDSSPLYANGHCYTPH